MVAAMLGADPALVSTWKVPNPEIQNPKPETIIRKPRPKPETRKPNPERFHAEAGAHEGDGGFGVHTHG
jgi:hypothetical protein